MRCHIDGEAVSRRAQQTDFVIALPSHVRPGLGLSASALASTVGANAPCSLPERPPRVVVQSHCRLLSESSCEDEDLDSMPQSGPPGDPLQRGERASGQRRTPGAAQKVRRSCCASA